MKETFYITGGGDPSVGIPDVEAVVTIDDNIVEEATEDWKEFLADMYDVPKEIIKTKEEELEEEKKMHEEWIKKEE